MPGERTAIVSLSKLFILLIHVPPFLISCHPQKNKNSTESSTSSTANDISLPALDSFWTCESHGEDNENPTFSPESTTHISNHQPSLTAKKLSDLGDSFAQEKAAEKLAQTWSAVKAHPEESELRRELSPSAWSGFLTTRLTARLEHGTVVRSQIDRIWPDLLTRDKIRLLQSLSKHPDERAYALNLASSLPGNSLTESCVIELFRSWTADNPVEASAWLQRYPENERVIFDLWKTHGAAIYKRGKGYEYSLLMGLPSGAMDGLTAGFATEAARFGDLELAAQMAEKISDAKLKSDVSKSVGTERQKRTPLR